MSKGREFQIVGAATEKLLEPKQAHCIVKFLAGQSSSSCRTGVNRPLFLGQSLDASLGDFDQSRPHSRSRAVSCFWCCCSFLCHYRHLGIRCSIIVNRPTICWR